MLINDISKKNAEFWSELCGSSLAKRIGIEDSSVDSLRKFDDWYFNFYPYLDRYIPFSGMSGKNVLEIGLGYGTVSQRLVESGSIYTGIDISPGPVSMVNHRLNQSALSGKAIQQSILNPDFKENSFDYVIAIGCLHHTGDLKMAIDNCRKILRPGGKLIFMVYYAYSYRRFRMAFFKTLSYALKESIGYRGVVGGSTDRERSAYDSSSKGIGAPYTDFISIESLKEFCKEYKTIEATLENIDREFPFVHKSRERLLQSSWPALCGLDLYVSVTK